MTEKRILAIDFGVKKFGLALSIPGFNIVEPLKTVDYDKIWEELEKLIATQNIEKIVIGLPLRTDGSDDKTTEKARKFADEVHKKFNLPVKLWDERYTTLNAESILKEHRKRLPREKGYIDKFAAAVILEEYLASIEETD